MIKRITYHARLINKQTGVVHPGEFQAPPDVASAVNAAYERWGLTHKIITVYPKSQRLRLEWPNKLAAAMVGPERR